MKKSIKYLPAEKQEDLEYVVGMVLERIPQTQMIILYGSYATGKYIEYDFRIEFGIPTYYMSDYDVLVVTDDVNVDEVSYILNDIEGIYYDNYPDEYAPVQFINEDIHRLNEYLSAGRYFYKQLRAEGVMLYNTGKYKLARCRKLRYTEIKQQAEEYFEQKYDWAFGFLRGAKFSFEQGIFDMCSYMLQQACENLFITVRLVFTLENSREHDLSRLLDSVRKYSDEFVKIFPRKTKEEKRLFNLLKAAYIEGRYNSRFEVTREDIESLLPVVERFFEVVKELCNEQIKKYGEMM